MEQVNIIIGRFQPLTKGHLKCIEQAYKEINKSTVICMIDTIESKADERHPFPSILLLPLYKQLLRSNKLVRDIVLVKNANIVQIVPQLREEGYEPISWACGTDRVDSYQRMVDRYGEKIGLSDNFKIIEIKRTDEDISATKCREALLKNDPKTFYRMFIPISLSDQLKLDPFKTLKNQIDKIYNNGK